MHVEYKSLSLRPTCLLQTRSGDTIRFTWLLKKPNKNFINSADICLFKIKKKH